jgi:hypothetical protein
MFFLFFAFISYAQNGAKKYDIVDIQSNTPIPYVTVFVTPNANKSTISNINGEFNIKPLDAHDTVTLSCIGYSTKQFTKNELDTASIIYLTPNVYTLAEVNVTPFKALKLVESAYANVKNNYPEKYPILKGIYRQQTVEDSSYVLFAECKMKVEMPKYADYYRGRKSIPKIEYDSIKLSENKIAKKGIYNIFANGLLLAYPESNIIDHINDFIWTIDKTYEDEDNQLICKILFKEKINQDSKPNRDSFGYIYISLEDSAILKLEIIHNYHNDVKQTERNSFYRFYNFKMFTSYNFAKVHVKYQLTYSRCEWHYDFEYSSKEEAFQHKYIVAVDFLTQSSYEGKLSRGISSRILPFREPKKFEQVNWDHFKTILPDYEK